LTKFFLLAVIFCFSLFFFPFFFLFPCFSLFFISSFFCLFFWGYFALLFSLYDKKFMANYFL